MNRKMINDLANGMSDWPHGVSSPGLRVADGIVSGVSIDVLAREIKFEKLSVSYSKEFSVGFAGISCVLSLAKGKL